MKIATFADLHIGQTAYGYTDAATGLNTRTLSGLASFDAMIDYCIEHDVKVLVGAGDMYKNAAPTRTMSNEFDKRVKRISEAGITFLLLDGNHDVSRMETTKSPTAHYETLNIPNVTHTRFYKVKDISLDGETVRFVFLPTYHDAEEIAGLVQETDTETYPTVFIFHGTIQGAMLNDWNIAEKETYVPLEAFDKPGVAAVVMGHLHKPQILGHSPLVYYVGSTSRIDFTEEKQPKGFVMLDVHPDCHVDYEFIDVPSQEFLTIKVNVEDKEQATDEVIKRIDKFKDKISDAIVRVIVDLKRSQGLNDVRILEYVHDLGASFVLDIKKNYPKEQSVRVAELTSDLSEEEALRMYYKDKENAESKIKRGLELIEAARSAGKL